MNQHSITIVYQDPVTKKKLTREYKLGVGETYDRAILSIRRALNFIYQVTIRFDIVDEPGY